MSHRVAILGAGIGQEHMAGYLNLPDQFQVVSVCDLDIDKAAALAGAAKAVTEIDAVLDDPAVDIIDICLPPSLHTPVAIRALKAGKHVICEKPVAATPAEAHELSAWETSSGKRVFPVFQYRFGRGIYQVQRLAEAGLLGQPRIGTLETHWNRDAAYYAVPWRGTRAYELGGAVMSHAIHIHDLIGVFFGKIDEVSAKLDTLINPIETEDCGAILMRFANQALVTSSLTLGSAEDRSRMRLIFENLTIESGTVPYAPGQANWRFHARDPGLQDDIDAVVDAVPKTRPQGFAGLFAAIAQDLDTGATTAPRMADGVASIELAAAIYRANRLNAAVSLPLSADCSEFSSRD